MKYTSVARSLHWLMALAILGLLALGFTMHDLPFSPRKLQLYAWHKWAGVSIFVLAWIRLAWRVTHRPPPFPATMPKPIQWLAHAGHAALYLLMFAIPLSGWLMSSAKGFQTVWFGLLPLPDLVQRDRELGDVLQSLHAALNFALLATLAGHVAAALWHQYVARDGSLDRMR
ncbi:MAG: hypothetical protein RLZZ200_1397 [Pseudomonadota bacterium]|jgi:cytochrome b561